MATDFDAIIIGAGVSGLYQLYRLRELGLTARVFEAGSGVGGTWYWNRYPGARFDSESWTYGYSFSQELLDEWDWEEHFAGQPETERYLNHVADKFDLRRDIQFKTTVTAAHYQEDSRSWKVTLDNGTHCTARFLITAVGVLSASVLPRIPGIESFKGQSCHTHNWPKATGQFCGQARRGDRHRRHRHPGHHGNRQDRGPPDRVPAHRAMVGAVAQLQGHARRDARNPQELRRYLRPLPGNPRLLHPRRRPPLGVRGDGRGTRGVLGKALWRTGLRHLDGQFPRRPGRSRGQQADVRLSGAEDPRSGSRIRRSRKSWSPKRTALGRGGCRWKAAISRFTTSRT